MDLRTQLLFDADPATVFAMLTDEEYIGRKARAANAIRHEVSVISDDDRVTIRLLRVMPPDVPDFVRRFVGDTIDLHQTDVWEPAAPDGSRTGTIAIDMAGAPVTLRGTLSLTPDGAGSVMSIAGKIKASVPFVGGKIEQAVHGGLIEAAKREEQVGKNWLGAR
ncbi:MAG TPA: DUF2505 domain-containing protein [Jiangellaceae bacterium]